MTSHSTSTITPQRFVLRPWHVVVSLALALIGAAVLALTYQTDSQRVWVNILLGNVCFTFIALAGTFFVALQYVAGAGWATTLRRVPEAMSAYLPVGVLVMLAIYFGMHDLYHWSDPHAMAHDKLLASKAAYLNVPFFFVRIAIYGVIWMVFSALLRKYSRAQDESGDLAYTKRNVKLSAIFVALFALSVAFASFDWLMSIEPHWYSTMYGVYGFAGLWRGGLVVITLLVVFLLKSGYLNGIVNENHLHDLGKFVFAFSVFWAYIWFSQFMLIWYANLPEEVTHYLLREEKAWKVLFYVNVALNWLLPFFALMTRASKRNAKILAATCIALIAAYWLDLFMLIAPAVYEKRPTIPFGVPEIASFLGFAGIFFLLTLRTLSKGNLVPLKDPYLVESLNHHQ